MVSAVLILTVIMTVCGIVMGQNARSRFQADGYILSVDMDEDSMVVPNQIRFASGTAMDRKASSGIAFVNEEGQDVWADGNRFVHYMDESITSVNGMLLTDLSRFPEGLMDSYYLDALLVLQNADHVYTIENNTKEMNFENFLLKTGENHYLLASPSLVLQRSGGDKDTIESGFLEIQYLDNQGLVVNATDGERAWQFLADGSTVTLANGAVLNLGRMELTSGTYDEETGEYLASIPLSSLDVSANGGIQIASASDSAFGWTAPTFVMHAIDGRDGLEGSEGTPGETGEDGENGENGEDGSEGAAGAVGDSGSGGGAGTHGQRGAAGKDGENTDDDENLILAQAPFVNITSWDQTAGSVDFKLCAYNTELIQAGTTEAYILDVSNGTIVASWNMELAGTDGTESAWNTSALQPDTEYKLVISAMVLKSEDETNAKYAKSILLSRTFSTDENGFYLKKVQADYITADNIGDYDADKASPNTACLGFTVTLPGSQKLESITDVKISYRDKDTGELILLSEAQNQLSDEYERELLKETAKDGSIYFLHGLKSDTEYVIEATAKLANGKTSHFKDTYRTLKATPVVSQASFDTNENRFFISSVYLHKDEDHAITSFSHEVYRYYSGNGMTGDCLKRKTTTETQVYIYLSDEIKAGRDELGANYEYGSRIYVTWFDNEKFVTKEVPQKSGWRAQHIADSNSSYIELTDDTIDANSVKANLAIFPGTGRTIYVGDKDVHRILVQITSSGFTKVLYYSNLSEWKDSDGNPLSGTTINGKAVLPLELTGLAPGTTYTITVTAYFDSSTSVSQTVGSTIVKTQSN